MKNLKIFLINTVVFLISIIIVELIFGGWFKSNNLGAYFREHRMKKIPYTIKYNNEFYNYTYKRNYYGFKGGEVEIDKIQAVFIGGSTADERWKPAKFSIVEKLNKKLVEDNIDLKIINSGIEGQSTTGYIANFKFWYPKLDNFKPKYFIFYTGINELLKKDYNQWDFSDGYAKLIETEKKKIFQDNLKSRSFFYDSLRKIKHKYYIKKESTFMDLDKTYMPPNEIKLKKYDYLIFRQAYKKEDFNKNLKSHKKQIEGYLKNIDMLANYAERYSAKAIFINQVTAYGGHHELHVVLNYLLKNHCIKMKYYCIDIATNFNGKKEYWYDWVHTTPLGSEVISDKIYPELKKIVKND